MGGVHTSSIGVRGARRGAACCGARSDDLSARFASSLVQTEHAESAIWRLHRLGAQRWSRVSGVDVAKRGRGSGNLRRHLRQGRVRRAEAGPGGEQGTDLPKGLESRPVGNRDHPVRGEQGGDSFSAMPSCSMLLSSAGVTRTIPMREFRSPLSISRISRVPRGTSLSLNQTDAPLDSRLLHSSAALLSRSSQA